MCFFNKANATDYFIRDRKWPRVFGNVNVPILTDIILDSKIETNSQLYEKLRAKLSSRWVDDPKRTLYSRLQILSAIVFLMGLALTAYFGLYKQGFKLNNPVFMSGSGAIVSTAAFFGAVTLLKIRYLHFSDLMSNYGRYAHDVIRARIQADQNAIRDALTKGEIEEEQKENAKNALKYMNELLRTSQVCYTKSLDRQEGRL